MSDNKDQLIATPGVFGDNGNYLLERELGRGGMGGVYMGRDKMLDRPVAVKVMLKEYGSDEEFVSKFKKEAQAAAKLIHPNIAQIYSYGISNSMPYITMELVTGGSLEQLMRNATGNRPEIPRVLKICEQVAQALRCAADQGLVHGDIKPENILLDSNGNAKLVDFGLAGMQKDTSEIWGTPYYIAPEKIKKEPVDYRADMYNLGGTLYHALTGVAPFEGPDATAVVRKRFEAPPRKPSELRPEIPPAVDALVLKMLEKDKNNRFPTFEALLEEFKRVMATGLSRGNGKGPARRVTVRTTRRLTAPNLAGKAADPKNPTEAKKASGGYEEPVENGNPMKKAMIFTGAMVAVVVLCIIGGIFYFYSTNKAKEEMQQRIIEKGVNTAKHDIGETCRVARKFGDDFDEFAKKATDECEKATRQMAEVVPEFADRLKPEISAELRAAIALTNTLVEAGLETTNEVTAAAEPEVAKKKRSAAPAAPLKRFRPPTEEESDPASPEYEEYQRQKKAYEEEQLKLADQPAKESAPAEEEAKPEVKTAVADDDEAPAPIAADDPAAKFRIALRKCETKFKHDIRVVGEEAVTDINDLWNRAYLCQASAIKIRIGVQKVLDAAKKADKLNAYDKRTADSLVALSGEVVALYDEVKASKEVENVQKGISYIKTKASKSLKQTRDNLLRRRKETDREIKKLQYEIDKIVRENDAAENRKRLVEQEQEASVAKFEAIRQNKNFELLEWDSAIREIEFMKKNFKTSEGQIAADEQNKKIRAMKSVQEIIVKNMKGYQFRRAKLGKLKATVLSANMKEIQLTRPEGGETSKTVKFNINWVTFYKEYHANFNELIIQFIEKGRVNDDPKLTLQEWGDAMCGAALTLRIVIQDESATVRGEQIAKDVAKVFPSYIKTLRKMFPDIEFEEVEDDDDL